MLFLETDLAVYKRLSGYPLDAKGRPQLDPNGVPVNRERVGPPDLNLYEQVWDPITETYSAVAPLLPSYGIRIPVLKSGANRNQFGLTSNNPAALRMFEDGFEPYNFRQIPVFDENIEGRKFDDVFPCVTFRWASTTPEPKTYVYHDPFTSQDTSSAPVTIRNLSGDVVQSGYQQSSVRPHPEAYNVMYVITAWAKTKVEMQLISDEILKLFPQKGGINVQWASGETHTCDMLLQRIDTLDGAGDLISAPSAPEEQRQYVRAHAYLIEAYADNTVNKFGVSDTRSVRVIEERLMELDHLNGLLVDDEVDLNSLEILPIS